MDTKTQRKLLKKLFDQNQKMESVRSDLKTSLDDFFEFEFYIEIFPGDGICVGNENTANVAPLPLCLSEIEILGRAMTEEEHHDLCI